MKVLCFDRSLNFKHFQLRYLNALHCIALHQWEAAFVSEVMEGMHRMEMHVYINYYTRYKCPF